MLGLKRNEVKLVAHDPNWDIIAAQTIEQLWKVFGPGAEDIQHVGSTSIRHIKAKPDMLIAVGVKSMDNLNEMMARLQEVGLVRIENSLEPETLLCVKSSEIEHGTHTLYVHILPYGSKTWTENISFRDYMNAFPQKAAEYESLKISLAKQYPNNRRAYKNGKIHFFKKIHAEAEVWRQM